VNKKKKTVLLFFLWSVGGIGSALLKTYVETPFVSKVLFPFLVIIELISLVVIAVYATKKAEETINKR